MRRLFLGSVGALIFAGVPVVVWGPAQWGSYAADPVRIAYTLVAVVAQVLVAVLVPGGGRAEREGVATLARQRIAVVLLQGFSVGTLVISPWSDRHGVLALPEFLRFGGLLFYVVGAIVMNWSVAVLGRHFSVQVTIQDDHRLVTEGPYRWVRHPRYFGIFMCFLGIALVFASGPGLIVCGLLAGTLLWRIADEEVFMAEALPEAWPAYAKRTARLIPFLY